MKLIKILVLSLVSVSGAYLFSLYLDSIPDVLFNTRGECIQVTNYNTKNYTCGNLPDKYNRINVR